MSRSLGFAGRLLLRHLRGGELNVLLWALTLAVATVSSIALFADRLQRAIVEESGAFLAADQVLTSPDPVPQAWLDQAERLGLRQARGVRFASMSFAGSAMQLTAVAAYGAGYPLKGELKVSAEPFGAEEQVAQGPEPGTAWAEARLLALLGIGVGDQLELGAARLRITRVLVGEPDLGGDYFSVGPRLLMHLDDLAATQVIQPGSRVEYRYLFAAAPDRLRDYGDWLRTRLTPVQRWIGLKEGRPPLATAVGRAEQFLLLGGSLGVLLCGAAVALAARRFSEDQLDAVAVMKSFGATSGQVLLIYLALLLYLGTLAVIIGELLGLLLQHLVIWSLGDALPKQLPAAGWLPWSIGALTGFLCLAAFALPPLLRLRALSPLRVLRRDAISAPISTTLSHAAALLGMMALLRWYGGSWRLTLLLLLGLGVAAAVSALFSWLLLRGGRRLGMQAGNLWRLALAGLQRRARSNYLQVLVFSVVLMLLLIIIVVRTALIDEWRRQLPEGAPNHFALNIAPQSVEPLRTFFASRQIAAAVIYPVARGRITAINGESPLAAAPPDQTQPENYGVDREINLSWSTELPTGNRIIAGVWGQSVAGAEVTVSLEQEFASRHGLGLGDRLTLRIGEAELLARVGTLRRVEWDSMQPNFYLLFQPDGMERFPHTYLTSFYLPPERKLLLNELLRAFPSTSVIEVDALIRQIQRIVSQVTQAINLVLLLILLSGLLVLVASVRASMEERFLENGLLRALGASRRLILGSLLAEFSLLGAAAGLLAVVGAELALWGLYREIFRIAPTWHPLLWLLAPPLGALLVGGTGLLVSHRVVSTPPMQVLREYG